MDKENENNLMRLLLDTPEPDKDTVLSGVDNEYFIDRIDLDRH